MYGIYINYATLPTTQWNLLLPVAKYKYDEEVKYYTPT